MWIDNRSTCVLTTYCVWLLSIAVWSPTAVWGFDPYTGILAPNDLREQIPMGIGWGEKAQTNIVSKRCFADISPAVRIPRQGSLRTHPWLAEQALAVFEREYGIRLDDMNPRIKAEILLGTIEEDLDLVGEATDASAYTDVELDECVEGSIEHVLTHFENPYSRSENHFYDRKGGLPRSASIGITERVDSSIKWATTSSISNHTWQKAKNAARIEATKLDGWRSLGHILHLLQDTGVPAHVRDDVHALRKEPYEKYLGEIPYADHGARYGLINVNQISPTTFRAAHEFGFNGVEQFIGKLAEYTQANYFSEDTVFLNKIDFEEGLRELLRNTRIETYNEGVGSSRYVVANFPDPNLKFPNFSPDLSNPTKRRIATYKWRFFIRAPLGRTPTLSPRFPTSPDEAASISRYMTVDDESIVADYWDDMARRIIATSAELIKLFYDEVTAPLGVIQGTILVFSPVGTGVGALVELRDPDSLQTIFSTQADSNAFFQFDSVPPGEYVLHAEKDAGPNGFFVGELIISVLAGQTIDQSVALTQPNQPPTVSSLTRNPASVQVGAQSTISVLASDPDAADILLLTYDWSATCGVLSGTTGAGNKTWNAPSAPGTCTISVTVADPAGASAMQSVDIEVTPVPSTAFTIGNRIQVATGDGSNLNVRSTPGGTIVGQQPDGSLGTVIGGPVFVDGRWWWKVDFDSGVDGWTAEDFLEPPPLPIQNTYTTFSVFNAAAPDAIAGHVEGPVFSVDHLP